MMISETLMLEFSENTGLNSEQSPRRYLWTDAFAVCNFIQLYKLTEKEKYRELAIELVDQVHSILGKYRPDDQERNGWLSSEDRPTKRGLRIGKEMPERGVNERYDPHLEWERDGQYFHYLTKWMIALVKMGIFLNEKTYFLWASDLVEASTAFINEGRMRWKMSIDLDRALVPSMGQHDPLDGYVSYKFVNKHSSSKLGPFIRKMKTLTKKIRLPTEDPLGIGALLVAAYRLYSMNGDDQLNARIIDAAQYGLKYFNEDRHSLAFRELGLAIGLQGAQKMGQLEPYWSIKEKVKNYWLAHRDWREHQNINQVMLVTSLIPDEFLDT